MRLAALGLLLLWSASAALASVDNALLSMAPPSTTVLSGIDVQRAANSGSGARILEQTMGDHGLANLLPLIGLTPRRDLRRMLIVELGQGLGRDSRSAVLASGTFGSARLLAVARSRGVSTRRDGQVSMIVQRRKPSTAIAFPRAGVLVIEEVGDALPRQLRTSQALESITRSSGGLQFGQPDKVSFDLVARTPGDARLISGELRVSGTFAHLPFGGSPGFLLAESVLSSMHIASAGSAVHVTSAVSDAEVARALASSN